MEITIKRRGGFFQFFEEGEDKPSYFANWTVFLFRNRRKLFKGNQKVSIVKHKISDFSYEIKLLDRREQTLLRFSGKLVPPFWLCPYKYNSYKVIPHIGRKVSIFKNGKQIAFYSKEMLSFMDNQSIQLVANDDIDKALIYSFILCLETSSDDDQVTIDFGNLGPEMQSFDENWTPT